MDDAQLTARREELFRPIHQQILMTDDKTDVILLATNMLASGIHILFEEYGEESTRQLLSTIIDQGIAMHRNRQ
jgi:hypothetical protein